MTLAALINQAVSLPPAEKLDLIGAVWDSLDETDANPSAMELEAARQALLDYRAHPDRVMSWDEHWEQLTQRFA